WRSKSCWAELRRRRCADGASGHRASQGIARTSAIARGPLLSVAVRRRRSRRRAWRVAALGHRCRTPRHGCGRARRGPRRKRSAGFVSVRRDTVSRFARQRARRRRLTLTTYLGPWGLDACRGPRRFHFWLRSRRFYLGWGPRRFNLGLRPRHFHLGLGPW